MNSVVFLQKLAIHLPLTTTACLALSALLPVDYLQYKLLTPGDGVHWFGGLVHFFSLQQVPLPPTKVQKNIRIISFSWNLTKNLKVTSWISHIILASVKGTRCPRFSGPTSKLSTCGFGGWRLVEAQNSPIKQSESQSHEVGFCQLLKM